MEEVREGWPEKGKLGYDIVGCAVIGESCVKGAMALGWRDIDR